MDLGYALVIGLAILCSFGLIGFIAWVEFKKSMQGTRKPDPLFKGLIISFTISGMLFLAEAVGFFEKGWNQKFFWIHLLLLFTVISIYMLVASRKKPLPYWKQKLIVINVLKAEYFADIYTGLGNIRFLDSYNYLKIGESDETIGEVGSFLCNIQAEDTFKVWVQINAFTGQLLKLRPNPPTEVEYEALKGKPALKDRFSEEFEGKIVNNEKTE